MKKLICITGLFLAFAASAQTVIKENVITNTMVNHEGAYTSAVDKMVHGFIFSAPLNYDSTKPAQLLVFLHGAGEKPGSKEYDLTKLKGLGPHREIYGRKRSFPAVIASIQMEKWAPGFNPAVVKEFIEYLCGRFNINRSAIHLTGLSQGGFDTYKTAWTYPIFASISVFDGYTGTPEQMALITCPVFVGHNSGDATIGVQNAYNAKSWLKGAVTIAVANASGHDGWTRHYSGGALYEWHWSKVLSTPLPVAPVQLPVAASTVPAAQQSVLPAEGKVITLSEDMFSAEGKVLDFTSIVKGLLAKAGELPLNWSNTTPITITVDLRKEYTIAKIVVKDGQGTPSSGTVFKAGSLSVTFDGKQYNTSYALPWTPVRSRYLKIENYIPTSRNLPTSFDIFVQ